MAFAIDDALSAAAAGVDLTETIVKIVDRYKKKKTPFDFEILIKEIRIAALKRIDEADLALNQLERTLLEQRVDIDQGLIQVIADTPFWRPYQQYRLRQIRKSFNELSDCVYCAIDDIAALVRCYGETEEVGTAVVESAKSKQLMRSSFLNSKSVREAIAILRDQLGRQKLALNN